MNKDKAFNEVNELLVKNGIEYTISDPARVVCGYEKRVLAIQL